MQTSEPCDRAAIGLVDHGCGVPASQNREWFSFSNHTETNAQRIQR